MSVDILAIGQNNNRKQTQNTPLPAWQQKQVNQGQVVESPTQRAKNTLDRQVEIGLGSKIDDIMTKKDKQIYADGLSDTQWNLMQRYKAEGYSFEASKALVENQKKLADPYAQGTNKYKDYEYKENYYNKQGITVDPDSNIYKIGSFLEKIGFNEEYGNPLNKIAQEYNEWAAKEREAIDTIQEDKEANLLEQFGWWLQRSLMTAESGLISGLAQIGNAVQGIEDIKSSAVEATLDRAVLGLDTDLNYYREEDRRLDEYLWQGASGGLNTIFWAWAPKMMMAFSAIGETEVGGTVLEKADGVIRGAIKWGLENGLPFYYDTLDEQGKEDMLDTMTTLAYMEIAKRTKKRTGKLKTTKIGIEYDNIKNQFRTAMNEGAKGVKNQAKAEVKNVKESTPMYNEKGTKIGSMGPQGEVGVGKSIGRVINAGIDSFKQSYIDRLNARHGGNVAEPGTVEVGEPATAEPTKTNESKGVVDRAKDIWDTKITGLTPEERIRVQNDPYTIAKWNTAKQMLDEAGMPLEDAFITEKLYEEIGDKIIKTFQEWETKLDETSPYYNQIRQLKNTYNLIEAEQGINNLLAQNDIGLNLDGTLNFNNSKFVSEADMRSVQRAVDMINRDIMSPLTPRKYLNLRKKLDQLASYATVDASRGQSLIRQLRYAVDDVAKKQIPGLKELDSVTKERFKEIQELKEGWVYKGGDRKGEIRNNFYSIIKNLTGQNRKVMLDRLEKYYPGVTDEIEAIHITEKLIKAYNKSPQIIKSLGIGGAIGAGGWVVGGPATGLATALLGAIVGELIQEDVIKPRTKKLRRGAIEKLVSEMSPQARQKLEEIARKQTYAKELSAEETAILERVAQTIVKERERGLSEKAVREWMKRTRPSDILALPESTQGGVVAGDKGFPTTNPTSPTYEDLGLGNIKEINGKPMLGKRKEIPLSQVDWSKASIPSKTLYDLAEETPLGKFDGKLTAEQKQEGRELYKFASRELDGADTETDKDIIAARGKFLVMNQKPGYTKALGLDQGQVNETITKWWEQNGGAGEKAIQFNKWINDGAKPQYRFMGISNLITTANPWRGIDAINYLVKEVKTAEDPTKTDYKPWIDATIDSLLLTDSHFNYGDMSVRFTTQEGANQYALELAKRNANGEFVADILSLIGGQGKETISHETGHGADAIMGIELFGADFIRKRGAGEMYATGRAARSYYENNVSTHDGKWRDVLDYKTPEAMEFHKQILDLMDKIEVPEWMRNDLSLDEDGQPMNEYRTRPEEVWARFHQANIRLTRDISEGGRIPKKYKSDHGDTYPIELYKEWVQLFQRHQELAEKGAFYKVEPINRSGISTMNGLRNYPRQKTPEELEHYAGEMLQDLGEILRGFDMEAMLTSYNKDLMKWGKAVEKKLGKDKTYGQHDFIDFYLTLKAVQSDPEFMEGLKLRAERIKRAQENGTAYGKENVTRLYDILSKGIELYKGKLPINVRNQELIEPLRRWIIQHGITRQWELDKFYDNYSPDTIYWKGKMSGRYGNIPLDEFKELEKIARDIANTEDIDWNMPFEKYSNIQVGGMAIDRLIDTVGGGIGETFAEKRIQQVANDMWDDVMEPLGDIFRNAIDQDKGDYGKLESYQKPDAFNEFSGIIFYELGETYSEDIAKRGREINQKIHDIASRHGIVLKKKTIIPEQKLQGLSAKLKEILSIKGLPQIWENQRELHFKPLVNERLNDLIGQAFQRKVTGEADSTEEATKQLVALSNMDIDKFEAQMKKFGGKSPMPSIAVTDVNVPHTAFGDLTLVFGKNTVDPQADPRNTIYASDAWTTTFPDVRETGGITFESVRKEVPPMVTEIVENGAELDTEDEKALTQGLQNELLDVMNKADLQEYAEDYAVDVVDGALDRAGLDRNDNEGAYLDLERGIESFIRRHAKQEVIPGYYFKGQVQYDDPMAVERAVNEIYDNLTPKGRQKLKDDGWAFDESDQKYVINQRFKDAPPKQGIRDDIYDKIIERVTDYPNNTPEQAGREFYQMLTNDYGLDKEKAVEIAESLFGQVIPERLTEAGFSNRLMESMPLSDGDMGEDYGEIPPGDLDRMRDEMDGINRNLARDLMDEFEDGGISDGRIDELIDEWEEQIIEKMDSYVEETLYDKYIEGNPDESEISTEERYDDKGGEEIVDSVLGGAKASLGDMKMFVKDVAKNELLIEEVNRDRPFTVENVLEAMVRQGGPNRTVSEGSLRDLVGVEGKKFENLEQVRAKNLAKTTHDDRTGDLSGIEQRYETVVKEIRDIFTAGEEIPEDFSTQTVRQEIKWSYDQDLETFRENLEEENPMWEDVPDDYLQAIIDAVEMGKQVPVRFSESKPERIVDLYNEVQYVLVPEGDREKVNQIVKGTPLEGKVYSYDRGSFKSARGDKIKQLQRRYGNIFFGMGGLVMPIAMLMLMEEKIKES